MKRLTNDDKITIYALQFNPTKKIYIGSTVNLTARYLSHIGKLKKGTHSCKQLQDDFKKYGEKEDFSVYVLEELEYEGADEIVVSRKKRLPKRRQREYEWMKTYKTYSDGYNTQDKMALNYINDTKVFIPLKEGKPELPKE